MGVGLFLVGLLLLSVWAFGRIGVGRAGPAVSRDLVGLAIGYLIPLLLLAVVVLAFKVFAGVLRLF